ncbi:hypothetical protein SPRG_21629 [Saprolegnia parasitica CBS 223.65]|uniref:F-box domain-containing protein n=1 Tax=Saprolegnia parasitica (strain CBS 223.65) TaxID=695850 RepID=A0A067BQ49_SAPPC|nr:hypothetical protein SPRG_21629 [Saprolegnia parasitica CBS 223.65]KDO18900.1 hypothetical protein SPRG_21629 [Saprolegnia parasitica CBS 223.65]|eukprot:XP_012210393.1 hypothetical protein SPRG_21629 [Saprolegnia parasitica CBS 223.65]
MARLLRVWIRDALGAHGYACAEPLIDDAAHGIAAPLVLRGLVLGQRYLLHVLCDGETWRVDFALASYIPARPALYAQYAEYVRWRVEKSILQRHAATAQALLDSLPEHLLDGIVGFLAAPDVARAAATCRVLYKSTCKPRVWAMLLLHDFQVWHEGDDTKAVYIRRSRVLARMRSMHLTDFFGRPNDIWHDDARPSLRLPRLPYYLPAPCPEAPAPLRHPFHFMDDDDDGEDRHLLGLPRPWAPRRSWHGV